MNDAAVSLLMLLALVAANLPFLNNRTLGFGPVRKSPSRVARCLMELLVAYLLLGVLGAGLEHRLGQVAAQKWEFYAITAALFITLAFPGFVYRFLYRR